MDFQKDLKTAIVGGDAAVVERLLDQGADPNEWVVTNSFTPLLLAVNHGHIAVITLLLARGADPNLRGFGGTTPLQMAIDSAVETEKSRYDYTGEFRPPSTEVVQLLLANGADPLAVDADGVSAIECARVTRHTAAEDLLRAWVSGKRSGHSSA